MTMLALSSVHSVLSRHMPRGHGGAKPSGWGGVQDKYAQDTTVRAHLPATQFDATE